MDFTPPSNSFTIQDETLLNFNYGNPLKAVFGSKLANRAGLLLYQNRDPSNVFFNNTSITYLAINPSSSSSQQDDIVPQLKFVSTAFNLTTQATHTLKIQGIYPAPGINYSPINSTDFILVHETIPTDNSDFDVDPNLKLSILNGTNFENLNAVDLLNPIKGTTTEQLIGVYFDDEYTYSVWTERINPS